MVGVGVERVKARAEERRIVQSTTHLALCSTDAPAVLPLDPFSAADMVAMVRKVGMK